MMKQARRVAIQDAGDAGRTGEFEVEGISGGGLVAVRMTAKMEVKGVRIDPSLMKAEEREVLEDLLVTALNDARREAGNRGDRKGAGADRPAWAAARIWPHLKWQPASPAPKSNA